MNMTRAIELLRGYIEHADKGGSGVLVLDIFEARELLKCLTKGE